MRDASVMTADMYGGIGVSSVALESNSTAPKPCVTRCGSERMLTRASRMLPKNRVAVIPGSAFGMADGCYFRIAYGALQKETVAEGIGRLVNGLRAILQ